MIRTNVTVAVSAIVAACSTAPVQTGERIPGGAASLVCAERLLRTLDYDVRTDEGGAWIQGEVRQVRGPAAARRELIRVALAADDVSADREEVEVQVLAFEYQPGMTSLPTRSQDVFEVEPSESTLDDAAMLRNECRGAERLRLQGRPSLKL
jgi:hypothetical protein